MHLSSERVELPVEDGTTLGAYVVRPDGGGPGVIVAHQLFGVTADIRGTADRIASWGYTAIAPDFYHRTEAAAELPVTDEGRSRGFALMNLMTRDGVLNDMRAALHYLGDDAPAGIVGLSMGGHLAYYAATQLPLKVAVILYAGWLTGTDIPISRPEPTLDLTPGIQGGVLFVVGEKDHVITPDQVTRIAASLEAAAIPHQVVTIPGAPHAFLAEGTPAHDEKAATRTWALIQEALTTL